MSDETVELDLFKYHETQGAYLVGESRLEPAKKEDKYWLPKSQVVEIGEMKKDGSREYVVKEWWAQEAGLI